MEEVELVILIISGIFSLMCFFAWYREIFSASRRSKRFEEKRNKMKKRETARKQRGYGRFRSEKTV